MDHLARNDELVAKAGVIEWDLVVVDEAHKMSAQYYGTELKRTKRHSWPSGHGSSASGIRCA